MIEATVSDPYRLSLHLPTNEVLLPPLLVVEEQPKKKKGRWSTAL